MVIYPRVHLTVIEQNHRRGVVSLRLDVSLDLYGLIELFGVLFQLVQVTPWNHVGPFKIPLFIGEFAGNYTTWLIGDYFI